MVGIQKANFKQNFKELQGLLGSQQKMGGVKSERKTGKLPQAFLNQVATHIPLSKRNAPLSHAKQVAKAYIRYIRIHKNQVNDLLSAKKAHKLFQKIASHVKGSNEKKELEREFHQALNAKIQKDLHEYMQHTQKPLKSSAARQKASSPSKPSKANLKAKKTVNAAKAASKTSAKLKKTRPSRKKGVGAQLVLNAPLTKTKNAPSLKTKKTVRSPKNKVRVPVQPKVLGKSLSRTGIKASKAHSTNQKAFKIGLSPKLKIAVKAPRLKRQRSQRPQLSF
ncbi:hypothetical protein [Parachlamydia sp. AcF125]|uniref:hypothetical protein n=1 Tax=Parachlamydia sp. AcF125 TaxID=2795736 RepID=UPI001BC985AA|nr:hypothetical protein [Parachlamydia sp. AcF125]MBS4168734.1 hypothetical protein [Parachlamydia sp. AcF125]